MAIAIVNSTIAEVASAQSLACNVPAGVTAGHILVASVSTSDSAALPSQTGWTTATSPTGTSSSALAVYYRIATASEPASYTFTGLNTAGVGRITVEMTALSGVSSTPLDITAVSAATPNGSITTPSVTTVSANDFILYAVAANGATATDYTAATGTTKISDSAGTGKRLLTAYEIQAAAGASTARTFTQTGTAINGAYAVVAFRPAPTNNTTTLNATTATGLVGTWTNATNATGAANATGTTAPTNCATWVNATSAGTATLELSGYNFQTSINNSSATISAVSASIPHAETSTTNISSITAQLYSGTTAIGSAVTVTRATSLTTTSVTFATMPTYAQLADLRVRYVVTRAANTTSSTEYIDSCAISVTWYASWVSATTTASGQLVGAISYVYADWYNANGGQWTAFTSNVPVVDWSVINPSSGPGTASNSDYLQQVQNNKTAGLTTLGYVATGYFTGAKTLAQMKTEIDNYWTWYGAAGLDGIFFDQASVDPAQQANYASLYSYVKGKAGTRNLVVINPGANTDESYMAATDIVMNWEGAQANYSARTPASWESNYPTSRFMHCIHDCAAGSLQTVINQSRQFRAKYLYITDGLGTGNTYGTVPSYFSTEVTQVASNNKTSTLTDDFTTKDTTKWFWGANASVVSGQASFTPTTAYDGYIYSTSVYDLTNSAAMIQVARVAGGTGTGTAETFFQVYDSGTNTASKNSISMHVSGTTISAYWADAAGTSTTVATATYSATTHAWWRIRHNGTQVIWETSPDGSTWTQFAAMTPTIPITSVYVNAGSGYFGTLSPVVAALIDNFNVAPSPASGQSPVYVAGYTSGLGSAASQTTTVTTAVGDLLLYMAWTGYGNNVPAAPTGGGLTWTLFASGNSTNTAGNAEAVVYTATATSAATFTLTGTTTGSGSGTGTWGFQVQRWSKARLSGSRWSISGSTSAQLTFTPTTSNSTLAMVVSDYNAINGASRTYVTASAGAFTETHWDNTPNYESYVGYYANDGAVGSKTIGVSSPTGQLSAMVAVELTASYSIYADAAPGTLTKANDGSGLAVATAFYTNANNGNGIDVSSWRAVGARYYLPAGVTIASPQMNLWGGGTNPDLSATPLATALMGTMTAGQWNEVFFPSPVALTPNTYYWIGYHTAASSADYLAMASPTASNIPNATNTLFFADTAETGNQRSAYRYDTGTSGRNNSLFAADVIVAPVAGSSSNLNLIHLGTGNVTLYLGGSAVNAVYIGSTKVYP